MGCAQNLNRGNTHALGLRRVYFYFVKQSPFADNEFLKSHINVILRFDHLDCRFIHKGL